MAALPNPWRCCWLQAQFLDLLGTTRVKVFASTPLHVREEDGWAQHPAAQSAQHPVRGGCGGQGINPSRRCPRALSGCDAQPGWVWERGRSPRTPPRTRQGGDIRAGRWLWDRGLFPGAPAWLRVPGGRPEEQPWPLPCAPLLTLFTTAGWIPSGSEAAWAERKAGFGLQPLLPPGSSSSSSSSGGSGSSPTPGPRCRQGEGTNSQRPLEARSCLQANSLCAKEGEECRARARRDSFETEL